MSLSRQIIALNQKKAGLLCTDANDDLSYKVERGLISAWNKVEDPVILVIIYIGVELYI